MYYQKVCRTLGNTILLVDDVLMKAVSTNTWNGSIVNYQQTYFLAPGGRGGNFEWPFLVGRSSRHAKKLNYYLGLPLAFVSVTTERAIVLSVSHGQGHSFV